MSAYTKAAEELGARLRTLRQAVPDLSGARLAARLEWAQSKVSRIETGRQLPTEEDLTAWLAAVEAPNDQFAPLFSALSAARDEYATFRRQLRRGAVAVKQDDLHALEAATHVRSFETVVIPGLVQTAEYARHMLTAAYRAAAVDAADDDLADATRRRLRRQEILYAPGRVHLIIGEAALYYRVCPPNVLRGQLDRLLTLLDLDSARIGIVPFDRTLSVVPSHDFAIYDDVVVVEIFSAELILRDTADVALYGRIFDILDEHAAYGDEARAVVRRAINAVT
ncbi:MAG: helix-turn-helix domain-containing protein [Actinobacteria bacterium]|nr:helix-turn-helix domain-containing protein [Actinomycetota bacterium]